jgi:putative lipoic acid-binding regulatory protein
MSGFTLWYARLSRKARIALLSVVGILIVIIIAAVGYMVLVPEKVQVRFGTIVRDPIDGHVWEDDTQTLMVKPSEAGNYQVTYVDKLSDEHQQQMDQEKQELEKQRQELANSTGVEAVQSVVPADTMKNVQTVQNNMQTMSADVITGMQIANEIDQTRNSLISFRNQVASMPLPPELEPLRQQGLQILDMAIEACHLTLEFIATGNQAILQQAQSLMQQAADAWSKLIAPFQQSLPTPQ